MFFSGGWDEDAGYFDLYWTRRFKDHNNHTNPKDIFPLLYSNHCVGMHLLEWLLLSMACGFPGRWGLGGAPTRTRGSTWAW